MNDDSIQRAIWEKLATIPDPEFGINIVDLGFIYSVELDAGRARVVMTLTTPTCPSGAWLYEGVKSAVRSVVGVHKAEVLLVFEPPWNAAMLSEEARRVLQLGS